MTDIPGYDNWKLQGPPDPSIVECQGCGKKVAPDESLVCRVCEFEGCVHCTPTGDIGELMFLVSGCEKHVNLLAIEEISK